MDIIRPTCVNVYAKITSLRRVANYTRPHATFIVTSIFAPPDQARGFHVRDRIMARKRNGAAYLLAGARPTMVDQFVARHNIEHFRELISKETDEGKLRTLQSLLAEEEEKVKRATGSHRKDRD